MDWINWDVIAPTGYKNTRYGPARDASGACTSVCYIVTNGLNVHPISLQQRMTEAIPITINNWTLRSVIALKTIEKGVRLVELVWWTNAKALRNFICSTSRILKWHSLEAIWQTKIPLRLALTFPHRLEIQRLLRQHAFIFCSSTCDPDNVWRTLFRWG